MGQFDDTSNIKNAVNQQGAMGYGPIKEQTDACRPSTMREQAEKNVGYHRDQADKHDRAVAFFRENPAFDEFIRLIREGVIGI